MKELPILHRFLIRNHGLLSEAQLADYLEIPEALVRRWMDTLGLPETEVVPLDRAFPVILRHNHDLLPDEEIAKLIGLRMAAYVKTVQEMDFLDIKLGGRPDGLAAIKPRADEFDQQAASDFRVRCARYFEDYTSWESRFSFLDDLGRPEALFPGLPSDDESPLGLRVMYSYTGTHGDFLLTGEDFYGDGILSRLRNRGVNAGWMPALLRDLAPSEVFPELGNGHEERIENLRIQVDTALRYGIKVYLYLNEPRFMPESFFKRYPESKGLPAHREGYFGLCTSEGMVRDWLYESTAYILSEVPEIGGMLLITASENRTNCWSHGASRGVCPRCAERGPKEVLGDTANILQEAVENSSSGAEIVQWLWGWRGIVPEEEIPEAMANLSPGVSVAVDWALGTPFEVFGKEAAIGEYTLAYTRPSEYAKKVIAAGRNQGRKVYARCAVVTTVEMNALPYLPVMENVEILLKELRSQSVDGLIGSWIFGSYPGRNMEMLARAGEPCPAAFLARKYYGRGAEHALQAWRLFSDGMKYYPTTVGILYNSALNPGPGLRFPMDPEPWRHGMVAMASEKVEEISQPLGAEVMMKGFRETAKHFAAGLEHLRMAVEKSEVQEHRAENIRDYGICTACMLHMLTAANYTEFILTRDRWLADRGNEEARASLVRILRDESRNAHAMLDLTKRDSRIGYEGSIGYFYTPTEIIEKIYGLEAALERLAG